MKKKLFSILLVLAILCTLLPVGSLTARASGLIDQIECNFSWDEESGTLTLHTMDDPDGAIENWLYPGMDHTELAAEYPWAYAWDKEQLTTLVVESGVKSILYYAFYNFPNLKTVKFEEGVSEIQPGAFANCPALTEVALPGSVTTIGNYAFRGCASLTAVTIPNSVITIGYSAFSGCDSLTEVTIPDSVTTIGEDAFSFCDSLTAVTIGDSVTTIGEGAFLGCDSLKSIEVSSANLNYSSKDGVLFDKPQTVLYQYPSSKAGAYEIPSSVTTIGDYAFAYCDSLTAVTIPNSVTAVGEDAFYYCDSLTEVTIGDSVTTNGNDAFEECDSLTGVYFRGDAPELGYNVFSIHDWESDGFINNPNLTLYYIEGKKGWTSPTWNGYPTATWDGSTYPTPDDPKPDVPTPDDPKPDDPTPPSVPSFTDVPADAWYIDAVNYAVKNGLMQGTGNGKFEPDTVTSRAMIVTVLWRQAGKENGHENTFSDVPDGEWYTDAVAWAAANDIVKGTGNGKFEPAGDVTREQMVTILYRYCGDQGIDTSKTADLTSFPDAGQVNGYALDAMRWAVAEGIINGKVLDASGTTYLQPLGNASRAEVATILMRFIRLLNASHPGFWRVAMITDYGDVTDQGYNQTTYEAGRAWCNAHGVDYTYYKPTGDSTVERNASVDRAVAEGYNVILMPGYAFADTIKERAETYPNVTFIALDVGTGDLGEDYVLPANVCAISYREEIAGFMAGYAAVKLGYTKLGFLGGMAVPAVMRYGYGFVQGADAAAAELGNTNEISVEYVYGNQFFGDDDITKYMEDIYADGCEIVFVCGGGIYTSAAIAAQKAGGKIIGVDLDQAEIISAYLAAYGDIGASDASNITVTSAIKGLDVTTKTLLTELIINGNWEAYSGQYLNLGLVSADDPAENYVQLAPSTQFNDRFTEADYTLLVRQLYNGELSVSNDVSTEPDVNIAVNYRGNIK